MAFKESGERNHLFKPEADSDTPEAANEKLKVLRNYSIIATRMILI